MKRIIAIILFLCLVTSIPALADDVDYESDYETALKMASNDLTNTKQLKEAIDLLQSLGAYMFAYNYQQYLQAVLDVQTNSGNLAMLSRKFEMYGKAESFAADLIERKLPSCKDLQDYTDARIMEESGNIDGALDIYQRLTVLDAPRRAEKLLEVVVNATPTPSPKPTATPKPTPTPTPKPTPTPSPTPTPKPIHTPTPKPTATPTPKPTPIPTVFPDIFDPSSSVKQFRFSMSADIPDELILQLIDLVKTWTKKTAPQTLDEFPLLPEGLEDLFSAATNNELTITEDDDGCIWHTTIGDTLMSFGFEEVYYSGGKKISNNFSETVSAYPLYNDSHAIRLNSIMQKKKLTDLSCYCSQTMTLGSYEWNKSCDVIYWMNNGENFNTSVSFDIFSFSGTKPNIGWRIDSGNLYDDPAYQIEFWINDRPIYLRYDYRTHELLDYTKY